MSKTDYQTAGSREPAKELTLQQLVIDTVESGNRTHMCSLCDCLWMHKDEYEVFGWIELLNNAILRVSAVDTKKTKVTREQFRYDEHFTFIETAAETYGKRNPHVFVGKYVTITRRDDGSLHLNFKHMAMGRGFNVKKYAAGVAAELRQA